MILLGCAGAGNSDPTQPAGADQLSAAQAASSNSTNRCFWGLWSVRIAEDHQSTQVVPLRGAVMHLNVVKKLEVEPCATCLQIENIVPSPPNGLEADLRLTHPFPGVDKLTGFDVRGIFMSGSSPTYDFPFSERRLAWSEDDPRLLNYDGYTSLFNPTEFPETLPGPPILKYIPGLHAPGGDMVATLNPFVAYKRDEPRRMFGAGGAAIRTVSLYVPDGPLEFGYAVDASWQFVQNVVDPVVDFPPDANCLEAYSIDVQTTPHLKSQGSSSPIKIEVFDHQGIETISTVTVEQPNLFAGEAALTFSVATGDDSFLFSGTITNELGATSGEYPLLVRVVDTETDQNLGTVDGWQLCNATVGLGGWVRTWGWEHRDLCTSVSADDNGNIYVTGAFSDSVDFDPGTGTEIHESNGNGDVFLSKFNEHGDFLWVRTWGGTGEDQGQIVTVGESGDIYVTGIFQLVVDFDPGPDTDLHASFAQNDVFLSKFDSSGAYQWAKTWGGSGDDHSQSVAIDGSGDVYVAGWFEYTVDFDPGPDTQNRTSNGHWDIYLTKFDSAGNHLMALSWGGVLHDKSWGMAVDGIGNVYLTGKYEEWVDFDPGPGEAMLHPNGWADAYLCKLNSSGEFQWAVSWGNEDWDTGRAIAVDSFGNAYVVGFFGGTVDFDPGPAVVNRTSNGGGDAYLTVFDTDGVFQWAGTWGSDSWDRGIGVDVNENDGTICVTGAFHGTVDFDPGSEVDERTSNGKFDGYLSKFTPSGHLLWVRTWGGDGGEICYGVSTGGLGDIYIAGCFKTVVDFNPGAGVAERTSNGENDAFLCKYPPDGNW